MFSSIQRETSSPDNRFTVRELCSIFQVSRSGYYRWLTTVENRRIREQRDADDFALILRAYNYRGYKKGARSIHMRLLQEGHVMNLKKIRRLMKKYHLFCPIRKLNPYRQMRRDMMTNSVADNTLNREFRNHGPRTILLTDITYIPLSGVFCYLSVIKDAFTMEILSYVLSESLQVDFVLQTVTQLMKVHGFDLNEHTLIHSDQGCHYTSVAFRELLENYKLRRSMSRRGNCWDNAPQESFFGHMKDELSDRMKGWRSFDEVKRDIDDWMDYYNYDRHQWALDKLTPAQFYQKHMNQIQINENYC